MKLLYLKVCSRGLTGFTDRFGVGLWRLEGFASIIIFEFDEPVFQFRSHVLMIEGLALELPVLTAIRAARVR